MIRQETNLDTFLVVDPVNELVLLFELTVDHLGQGHQLNSLNVKYTRPTLLQRFSTGSCILFMRILRSLLHVDTLPMKCQELISDTDELPTA